MRTKLQKALFVAATVCGVLLLSATAVTAQIEDVTITVVRELNIVRMEVSGAPQKNWSFRDTYAGVVGLGQRIKNFQSRDTPGSRNSVRKLAPGHFELGAHASAVTYEVDLAPPTRASDAAFVSWLNKERGLLQLSDLLPVVPKRPGSARNPVFVTIEMPAGWTAYPSEEIAAMRARGFATAEDGVIIVGKSVRLATRISSGNSYALLIDGAWAFSDQEALDTLRKVIELHSEVGKNPCQQVSLVLSTFPTNAPADKWSAETRGCNVTLLMGQTPSRIAALAQFGNALTHETFHLWIPNGVALGGEYDWFYEGFTMYQAARAAVRLGLISWPEFLNAIARAHDGSSFTANAQPLSLIEASKQRWTAGASTIYSKAMVVAFIYDLNVRRQSGGKRALDDVYRRILRDHPRPTSLKRAEADGNDAAIAALRRELSSADFVERFITAPVSIDLKRELAPFGLLVEKPVRTHISVSENLNNRQRDLLKQLGYNERRRRQNHAVAGVDLR